MENREQDACRHPSPTDVHFQESCDCIFERAPLRPKHCIIWTEQERHHLQILHSTGSREEVLTSSVALTCVPLDFERRGGYHWLVQPALPCNAIYFQYVFITLCLNLLQLRSTECKPYELFPCLWKLAKRKGKSLEENKWIPFPLFLVITISYWLCLLK